MSTQLKKNITIRYSLALALLAFLSIFSYIALQMSIRSSDSLAYIVNISGKQRMLSQHLALDVNKLYHVRVDRNNSLECKTIKNMIFKNAKTMRASNEALSTGKLVLYEDIQLSDKINQLYFDADNISQRVKEYTDLAIKAAKTESIEELKMILDEISIKSEPLLIDLNKVVMQYQKEGEEAIQLIKYSETFILIATLFILLLEVLLIFQPMVNNIIELSNEKNKLLESLQSEVEERTKELRNANNKLKKLAYYDPLSGLRNRLTLEKDIEYLLSNKTLYSVLMIDIDYFKDINDTYGHNFGDHVLQAFSKIFKNTFRENDKIYRVGGEEFVVILENISLDNALKSADKCRKNIMHHKFHIDGEEFHKTISIGLYHSSLYDIKNFKELYLSIDKALYNAKLNGRNRVVVSSE